MSDATEPIPYGESKDRDAYGWSTKYNSLHSRMRRQRGKASLQQCVRCDEQAKHWARLHGTDGTDIRTDYVPMCVKCHMAYDLGGRPRSAETRAILSEAARHRSPEHLRKISEALRGKPNASPGMTGHAHSEETRQKIREGLAATRAKNGPMSAEERQMRSESAKKSWAARRQKSA